MKIFFIERITNSLTIGLTCFLFFNLFTSCLKVSDPRLRSYCYLFSLAGISLAFFMVSPFSFLYISLEYNTGLSIWLEVIDRLIFQIWTGLSFFLVSFYLYQRIRFHRIFKAIKHLQKNSFIPIQKNFK